MVQVRDRHATKTAPESRGTPVLVGPAREVLESVYHASLVVDSGGRALATHRQTHGGTVVAKVGAGKNRVERENEGRGRPSHVFRDERNDVDLDGPHSRSTRISW